MIKIYYISNYGNEKFIANILKKNNVEIIRKGIHTGLMGCDPPYLMEVNSTKEIIKEILLGVKTPDSWGFYRITQ